MSTLSNVDIELESAVNEGLTNLNPPHGIIPDARHSLTGVSVSYVPDKEKQWFVFRASYGRGRKASDILIENGTLTYTPMHHVKRIEGEKRVMVKEPLLPSLVFAYTTPAQARTYVEGVRNMGFLTFYYDHFKLVGGKNPPLTVSDHDMLMFIKATLPDNEHIRLIDTAKVDFNNDDHVLVTEGAFAGVEGYVVRVAGQQRVAVTIKGLCTVATAYVPTAFLRKL
jgi:transcription antitermination factor NusG